MSGGNVTLVFYGGAGGVTGSNFLLSSPDFKLLVECGLFQGSRTAMEENHKPFPYDPAGIPVLLITHAHLDHIGRIPKLVKDGFRGTIYSTPATRDIAEVLFDDSISIFNEEEREHNRPPLYRAEDVRRALELWKTIPYRIPTTLTRGVSFTFRDAGHILGSAMIEISYRGKKIVFTGDLGNSPSPLLHDTEALTDATYLVMESVYGDRDHPAHARRDALEDAIENGVLWGGTILIPVFSVERSQTLLYEINKLVEGNKIPHIPVFVDSPLALLVTDIYRRRLNELNPRVQKELQEGDDIFSFPRLTFTHSAEESRAIEHTPNPKIVIAGSGMSHGGRIMGHERRHLPDPKSTLLIIGYQAAGSLGRQLQDGAREVIIGKEKIAVRARVVPIAGYSAHKDSSGLFAFVERTADTLQKVFIVMGEPHASFFLAQRVRDYLGVNASVPEIGESVTLEF